MNRQLLGGTWYFRRDDSFVGEDEGWYAQDDLAGWSAITVPYNWNATDTTENRPTIGWYRKEFTVPKSPRHGEGARPSSGRSASRATTTAPSCGSTAGGWVLSTRATSRSR